MPEISYITLNKISQILGRLGSNEAKDLLKEIQGVDWRSRADKTFLLVAFIPENATLSELRDILTKVNTTILDLTGNRPPVASVRPEKGARLFVFRSKDLGKDIVDKIRLNLHGSGINIFMAEMGNPASNTCFSEDGMRNIWKMTSPDQ